MSSISARRQSASGKSVQRPRSSCRPPGEGLGLFEARGCLHERFSVSPAGRFHPPQALVPRCPSARPVPLCDCSGFFSHVYAAQAADSASSRVTSWRPTRMGFHHEEGGFQGARLERSSQLPLSPGPTGARLGAGRDSPPGCWQLPASLGTWCPFRPLLHKRSPPAPASPSSVGPIQPS